MKAILTPYANFAMMGLSERKWKSFLRIVWGSGKTRTQKVAISAARSMNVRV